MHFVLKGFLLYWFGYTKPEAETVKVLSSLFEGNNFSEIRIPEALLGTFRIKFLFSWNCILRRIYTSGILNLPNIARLDLSYNNFTGGYIHFFTFNSVVLIHFKPI
ncbi:hypothetical protein Leryth_006586 [Lithospermum erythrorhizon]|nr:hypothetical protein Leryth_006586 [Lithospermum erythrorhizon]